MAALRWPFVVGILAITGGVAWFATRDGSAPASAPVDPQGSADPAGVPTGAAKAAIFAPEGPRLGSGSGQAAPTLLDAGAAAPVAPVIDAGPSPQQVAFSGQARDPAWAGPTEAEIKRRFKRLTSPTAGGAQLAATECRADQCELTFGGSVEAVGTTLADLETTRGLRGFARSVLLTAPEQRDGRLVVRVYATFDRTPIEPPPPKD